MYDFKILIILNNKDLLKEFEVHNVDYDTVNNIVESYVNINFNNDCKALYFRIV